MSEPSGDSNNASAGAVILLTGGLASLKDVSAFLRGQGIGAEIMRPEDCNINS